jgi:hypothetical protein
MATAGTMAKAVSDFRQTTVVRVRDVYWDTVTGRVFQYQGASDVTDVNASITFTELSASSGFISADSLKVSSATSRTEIRADVIKIYNSNVLRVKIGNLA